jgi:hypothetical protein
MIHNEEAYKACHWEFDLFDDCFDNGISFMDIDGIVEVNGKFIVLETKSKQIQYIPTGQLRTYDALRKTGLFTILFGFGDTNKPERYWLWTKERKVKGECDLDSFKSIIRNWYLDVTKNYHNGNL